jgi:hypothetical protein
MRVQAARDWLRPLRRKKSGARTAWTRMADVPMNNHAEQGLVDGRTESLRFAMVTPAFGLVTNAGLGYRTVRELAARTERK